MHKIYPTVQTLAKGSLGACYASYLVLQEVVTYMSHVEAFATGIKIEPSNQSPFGGADQGIKVTSKLLKINNQERAAAI